MKLIKNQVEWYTSHAKYQQKDGKRQLIYKLSVRFTDDESTYEFEVDCNTGGIVKIDYDMPGFTVPDGDGSGITHSLSHASASGVHVARAIAKDCSKA